MRYETINGHKFGFADSPEEMTFERWNNLNRNLSIADNVGSDGVSIKSHHVNLVSLIKKEQKDKSLKVMENLMTAHSLMSNGLSPKQEAFYDVLLTVDDKSISRDKAKELANIITMDKLTTVDEIKKKFQIRWIFISHTMTLWRIGITYWLKKKGYFS